MKIFILISSFVLVLHGNVLSQTPVTNVLADDTYNHVEVSVSEMGGSHGIFFGSKVNYVAPDLLWKSGNSVYAKNAGAYGYGAFSMGYIANGGDFNFYDGGVSTGQNNAITWNTVMSIKRGGKVAIGTVNFNDGNFKLYVEGGIRTREIKIDMASWADYVFKPNYKLRPLSEVEAFIKANKHLPEVPSAREVEKNGVNLGENQVLLLKKIEELTLYIIEQNKRQELLKSEIKELRNRMDSQQKLINETRRSQK